MESKKQIIAIVKSPARDAHLRKGRGFSLAEIKEAGLNVRTLKKMNIKIDFFRKSCHQHNIELLKKIEIKEEKREKRPPFVKKEKRKRERKKKPVKETISVALKEEKKEEIKKVKKPVKKLKEPKKEELTPLTSLSGLGPATETKFKELGVSCVEDLLKEDPKELAALIKGCSETRIKKWIEEGKELLK
ncbi:MAG: ribosomal protein L13e [Promethearchaeota archaeon]